MPHSNNYCWNKTFSHIYVEEAAYAYPAAASILAALSDSVVITIKHYKDVFSPRQDFAAQKHSRKLILAVKDNFIYKNPPMCPDYGFTDVCCASLVYNCVYDCGYCFLQGLFTSANVVAFVNTGDLFDQVAEYARGKTPLVCASYDTDLLAMEGITGFARLWIDFAKAHEHVTVELRTKSANYASIADITPADNVILAWSLSPVAYITAYETGTPGLSARINNINRAASDGWQVRLCVDPMLYLPRCADVYAIFLRELFTRVPPGSIRDICFGPLRAPAPLMKKMYKLNPNALTAYPFENKNGECTYDKKYIHELYDVVKLNMPDVKVYLY